MADAFGFEVERSPDGIGAGAFSGMGGEMEAVLGGARVDGGEPLGRAGALVASYAEGDHVAIAKLYGEVEDGLGFFGSELADGVEDPEDGDAEIFFAALAAALEAFEDGGEILLAPEADADGDDDLGVKDVLRFEALHQAVGDEFVVIGSAQVSGNVFEGGEESGEVFVAVELLDFSRCCARHVVALAEF